MINLIRRVVSNYNEVLNNAKVVDIGLCVGVHAYVFFYFLVKLKESVNAPKHVNILYLKERLLNVPWTSLGHLCYMDPMVDTWFLMESPGPILCIISAYLIFVLKIGPKMMKNRPAFQLNTVMIAYNAFQVLFNIWVITLILELDFKYLFFIHGFNNQNSISSNQQLARHIKIMSRGSWWYFITKVVELLDTVFFVLRRKQNQVTFLHVYHHTLTTLLSWCYLKYLPSVQGVMIALLNSIVHVIMYSYYLIAALGPNYKKYIWWKKYLTWIQLLQFSLILVYLSLTLIMDCRIPKAPSYLFGVIYIIFIYLFGNFYRQAYKKKAT